MSESSSDVVVSKQKSARPPPMALGINLEKPKFPQYAVYSKRMESFEDWPEYIPVKKDDLVEAGLVYTGVGDSVRCYFCGGGLRNWEQDDVPMEEHGKYYPKCPHVMLVKVLAYIERLQRGEKPEERSQAQTYPACAVPNHLESVAALSCIENGYSKEMVRKAIDIFIDRYGNSDFKATQLVDILFDLEEEVEQITQEKCIDKRKSASPPPLACGINVEKPKFPQYAVYSKRMETFESWPEYIPVKKDDLVEAGLVYTGVGDSVRCYFCGGGLRNWEQGDVPMEEHGKWYPKCPFINSVKGPAYIERLQRGEKTEEPSHAQTYSACAAAHHDGYSEGMPRKEIDILNEGHDSINQTIFDRWESCSFEVVSHTICASPPSIDLGINVQKPQFPQYAMYAKRMESFESWPEYIPVKKNDLAEAGLVYTGVGDSVRCYFCGGGLRNWEQDDVPMEEHGKWYPKCPHIMLVKGPAYIERLQRREIPGELLRAQTYPACTVPNHFESVAALSCIESGYSKEMVQKAIDIFIDRHGNSDFKAADLCEILFDFEEEVEEITQGVDESDRCYAFSSGGLRSLKKGYSQMNKQDRMVPSGWRGQF